jgi:hypothetical protein
VKRLTLNTATTIGAITMLLQIGKRYTPFSALHQFFSHITNNRAQVAAKLFLINPRWLSFKIEKECPTSQH